MERGSERLKRLAQEHNTMSPARSGGERTYKEASAPQRSSYCVTHKQSKSANIQKMQRYNTLTALPVSVQHESRVTLTSEASLSIDTYLLAIMTAGAALVKI